MLNVGKIEEGFVLDHIKAGKSLSIYEHLQLDKLDCTVAIIKNARSGKMGKKDILKVECDIDMLDLDVLAFIDHSITVNVIKNGEIVEKKELVLPKQIKNVIKCRNSSRWWGIFTILIPHHPLFSFHYLPASAYTLFLTLPELAVIAENQLIHIKFHLMQLKWKYLIL